MGMTAPAKAGIGLGLMDLAFGGGTPGKAFLTALVVGTILTAINHGDLVVAGALPPIWKVALTYCVPYCVTTWGAITGKLTKIHWLNTAESR
jgi:hypothetical protein